MVALRVLLVDDERVIREALRELLEDEGFVVVGEAEHGRRGVELAVALEPDVVLMDLRMPELDGISATRLIKQHLPDTRVIVLTAYDDGSLREGAMSAGAEDYLIKGSLADTVVTAIDHQPA